MEFRGNLNPHSYLGHSCLDLAQNKLPFVPFEARVVFCIDMPHSSSHKSLPALSLPSLSSGKHYPLHTEQESPTGPTSKWQCEHVLTTFQNLA